MTTPIDDDVRRLHAIKMHMRSALQDYRVSDSLRDLDEVMQSIRMLAEALDYRLSYGRMIEYDHDDGWNVYARICDADYAQLPDMRAVLPRSSLEQRYNALSDLVGRVLHMPSHEEYARGKWRQKLADLVTEGESLNVGMEFVEMLRATSVKLSTNIITMRSTMHDDRST